MVDSEAVVVAVCRKSEPGLPKYEVGSIQLVEDYGVEGDYHAGSHVRHRFLAKKDPTRLNHRQVLLADTSIYADISAQGISLKPGMLGENILVDGIEIMALPVGAQIEIGGTLLEVTEVRNPCIQLNGIHPQLLEAVVKEVDGKIVRNAGMLVRILKGGGVRPGDPVVVRGG